MTPAAVHSSIRVGFVLHVMQVAGAEMLVAETIRRLGSRLDPVVLCLDAVGQLGERLREEGVPVLEFGRHAGLDVGVPWRLAKVIRSHALDVVHAHQYTPFFYGAIAARLSRVRPRVIFTEHGRHYPDVVSAKRRLANRLVFDRLADEVNAVCDFSARGLSDHDGFRRHRIEIIENGVDVREDVEIDRRTLRAHLGLDDRRRYVITVARFHPVKDHRTLLRAFQQVAAARPDVDLLLAGDGSLRAALEQQTAEFGLSTRVRFLGVRNDVSDLLRAADVFALTSLSEAASLTLLEAMAAALPVVVTAVGGNPEIVRDGVDGLLAPRGDADAIASTLLRMLNDDALAGRLASSARARVLERYRLGRTIDRYYALYAAAHAARSAA